SNVMNLEHLRLYRPSDPEFGSRTILPNTRQDKPASEEYQVEKIVGHRYDKRRKQMLYLIHLRNAPQRLFTYRKVHGL
ncbi:hypothetical protein FA95DRAFT_1478406, partial [Auriscalpium vulgare]